MAHIVLNQVGVEFPIYNARGRALKHFVFNAATGWAVAVGPSGPGGGEGAGRH
jgi:hypothetical protein